MPKCDVCHQNEGTMICPLCSRQVCPDCFSDGKCLQCSQEAQSHSIDTTDERMSLPENLPPEFRKFNWGAFGCTFIWAASMNLWFWFGWFLLMILVFYPLYWIPAVYLGINGNRFAWKSGRWDSLQQFEETQKVWAIWGKVMFGIAVLLTVIITIFGYAASSV